MALRIGFLHLGRLGGALLCSLLFLSLADFESSQLQQGLDPGGLKYLGSPVVVQPTLPTLYYNCVLMPAICANVQQWLTANAQALPKDFHIQTGNDRNTAIRRRQSCPNDWSTKHPCPEPLFQPAVVHGYGKFINGNAGRTMVQFGNSLFTDLTANPPIVSIFTNEIAGTVAGESSGLGYTCDEFPPASWIEGGTGEISSANTFCAPQGVSCSSTLWSMNKNNYKNTGQPYPLTRSEQNWQAAAHSLLGKYFIKINSKAVGKFVFSTTSIAAAATPNAAVIVFPKSTKTITKRGLEHVETGFPDIPVLADKMARLNGSKTLNYRGVEVSFVPAKQTPAPVLPVILENVKAV
ncbi:hypothetical protein CJF32_00009894 [Rutstroemia sp. NJR-2017a WRK4]|nr:hypothetical protein CJF32_00009894 [Rutstroemia sp. NJR-2017a WRK4]